MSNEKTKTNYWLFQSNPKVFLLKEALEAEAIHTFSLKSHKTKVKQGDKIILWQAGKNTGCFGLATITGTPEKIAVGPTETQYFKQLPTKGLRVPLHIDYNLWNKPITKEILPNVPEFEPFYAGIPGTNFKATKAQYKALIEVIERLEAVEEPAIKYLPILKPLKYLNLILQGPPGTGKTYQTVNHALAIIEKRPLTELAIESRSVLRARFEEYQAAGRIQFLTFHQSYSYEDFVEGIKPSSVDGQISYGIEDGIFKKICSNAKTSLLKTINELSQEAPVDTINPSSITNTILSKCDKYVLIIDEINRGNIASIFGELITLLEVDKRAGQTEAMTTTLPYSKTSFSIPPNLHIIGTMNTSDKSTTPFDFALRRRFDFIYMPPQAELLSTNIEAGVNLVQLLTILNQRIQLLLEEDYLIGHAYFMKVATLDDLVNLFDNKIIPLLKEYFFGDLQKLSMVIGPHFFEQVAPPDYTLLAISDRPIIEEGGRSSSLALRVVTSWLEKDFIRIYEPSY